jgi:hypothetical protein
MGYSKPGERARFLVSTPNLARLYLLIKVHKDGFPGRAVVDQTGDPTYIICDTLTKILSPLSSASKSFVSNSTELKKQLQKVEIDRDCRLASLDVVSLYPSIPIEKALECTRLRLENDHTLEGRTDWSIENIMKILRLCLITYFKTLDGKIWRQTDGCPIGKSISGEIAELFMDNFENENIFNGNLGFEPIFWKRMRDDVFMIWKTKGDSNEKDELDIFVDNLNLVEERIKFTLEREEDKHLPFLDMMIKREEHSLITKVYRKKTHTQRYINWESNHSKNCKLGVIKGLIHRAHQLCDREEDLIEEINLIKDVFISNGYPPSLVERTVKDSWETELKKSILAEMDIPDEKKNKGFYDIIQAPYIKGFTESLQGDLKSVNVGFVMKKSATIRSIVCRLKPKTDKMEQKDVVYSVECATCKKQYIGETGKTLKERLKRHQQDIRSGTITNGFFRHLSEANDHKINWSETKILERESHWKKRKIKESIFINALNPSENITKILNIEKGVVIDKCWNSIMNQVKPRVPWEVEEDLACTYEESDGNLDYR